MQAFADVATFPDLAPCSVLLLLCCSNFAEVDLDIQRELEGWAMEGACFLFGETSLVLRRTSVRSDRMQQTTYEWELQLL